MKPIVYAVIGSLIVWFLLISAVCHAEPVWQNIDSDIIADCIFHAENSVKYPYGIKSINTHGNAEYARKICLNTINNNKKRFAKQTKYTDYIEFLGSRYCPTSGKLTASEVKLNGNWVRNVKRLLYSRLKSERII